MTFIFTPPDGLRNKVTYPTTPANEDAARDQVQVGMDQLRDYINNTLEPTLTSTTNKVDTMPFNMARQAIINGNFDVWQRGTTFNNPGPNAFTADRWNVTNVPDGGTNPNIIHSRVTGLGIMFNSFYTYRINSNGAGTGFGPNAAYGIKQRVELGTRFLCGAGKQVTISFYAKSDIVGKRIGVFMEQRYGTGGSPSANELINGTNFTLTSTYTKYTVTFTTNTLAAKTLGTNDDDLFQITLATMWGSALNAAVGSATTETFGGTGNIDIAQVQINAGNIALPFQPRSFGEELALCQRYYEKSFPYVTAPADATGVSGNELYMVAVATNFATFPKIRYKVQKRTNPTINFYNPFVVDSINKIRNETTSTNIPAQTANGSVDGFLPQVNNTGVVAGNFISVHWTADAEL